MLLAAVIVTVLVVAGHIATGVFANNRLHATGWPRAIVKLLSGLGHSATALGAVALAWWCMSEMMRPQWPSAWIESWSLPRGLALGYAGFCLAVVLGPLPLSLWRRRSYRP